MKPRRLVNIHTTGRYANIAHIHGVETGTPLTDEQMPLLVSVTMLDGRFQPCERVHSTERAVFYREVAE
jgi:hypothetical protein